MAAYQRTRVSLSRDGDTESVDALRATTALFRVLGVSPASGVAPSTARGGSLTTPGMTSTAVLAAPSSAPLYGRTQ